MSWLEFLVHKDQEERRESEEVLGSLDWKEERVRKVLGDYKVYRDQQVMQGCLD